MGVRIELVRYGVVGLATNAFVYVLYLAFTALGLGPKFTMSLLYVVGVLHTFMFNKNWTFRYLGRTRLAFWRYLTLYFSGYVLNFGLMIIFVDTFLWPHHWVMAGLVILMAAFFFVGQKFWVFSRSSVDEFGG